ncbi:hypothetical protein V6N13_133213 [Hibiscus sabdariffa]|uniref:Uncharacterized protein n=2 Tax=Hibiscus sabdariffa TaxID=183260 RepID=A0ABR1ZFE1_9ROSI
MSSSPDCDTVGRWGESLDDFSDDEENIVHITEDDDVHLLDADDVEAVMADASKENGLDVEDDVWSAAVARLGLGWEIRHLFGVMLDHRPSNRYRVIQLMNLQPACMTWTILQCGTGNTKLAYLEIHHLPTMGNWY